MWKPGSRRPRQEEGRPKDHDDGDDSSDHRRQRRSPDQPSPQRKQLSGATLGMRFMQRKNNDTSKRSPSQSTGKSPTPSSSTTDTPRRATPLHEPDNHMTVDQPDNHEAHQPPPTPQHTPFSQQSPLPHQLIVASPQGHEWTLGRQQDDDHDTDRSTPDDSLRFTMATPSDMYGPAGSDLLGRRSFGGFDKVVEETWNQSHALYFPNQKQSTTAKSKKRKKSAKGATIGNLQDKFKKPKT